MKHKTKIGILMLACMLSLAPSCFADDYPNHPVRVLVGYPPGGAPDVVARIVGQRLTQHSSHRHGDVQKRCRG
ncbi:MAG TPA: hypothetical protein VGM52_05085 [Herbaspirillum sp.]|jgi:tripartite-type tricarboxylate transporter receptor subunit TctC